jgi:outer membrane protein assembly factor BamB
MRNKENCSVLWNGLVYGIDEGGELRCVEFSTGDVKWSSADAGVSYGTESSVMIAGGELVAMSMRGDLVVVEASPTAYSELHRADDILGGQTWTCPVLANGRLYIRNHQGTLVCFDVDRPKPTRTDIDVLIRQLRDGSGSEAEVRSAVKRYREGR